jgi:hypothetical protein
VAATIGVIADLAITATGTAVTAAEAGTIAAAATSMVTAIAVGTTRETANVAIREARAIAPGPGGALSAPDRLVDQG